jgi:uncharacterized membrane protein
MTTAKKYLPFGFVLAFALTAGHQQVLRAGSDAKEFAFKTVDVSGTTTQPQGINDAGDISGILTDAAGIRHGFVLRHREPVATVVDFPGAAWTRLWGINPQGDVVGTYGYGPGGPTDIAVHGFLMSRDGEFTEIHYPGHLYEIPQRITSTGLILGCYHDTDFMDSMHAFTRSRDGVFTGLSLPNSMHTGSTPDGLTKVGIYDSVHSYVLDRGTFIPLDVPDSTLTWAYDINPQGEIVGHYRDLAGVFHGFFRGKDGRFTTLDVPGATSTQACSINARGEIVGFYVSGGRIHGFMARPLRKR